jgi:hypothetical protein
MHLRRSALLLPFLFALVGVSPARAQAWIEYTVTGAVSLENREEDVVMCSLTDEAFLVHTLGAWNVSIETDTKSPGEHDATFMVAAPDSLAILNDSSVDDRLKGKGSVIIEDGGTGQYGFPRVTMTFEAASLTSQTGKTIGITGRLVCDVM